MSKFLLNVLVQISKVCQKSKFQIKFERILFLELWPSSDFRPSRDQFSSSPTGPLSPSPWASAPDQPSLRHPAFFFLRTKPTERRHPLAPHHTARRPLPLSKRPEHSPLITFHHPADPFLKWHIMELHYAATSPSMAGRLRSSPQPYKRRPSTPATLTPPRRPTLSFPSLLSSTANAEPNTASETPLHRHPTRGDRAIELADPSLPTPAPWTELSGTGAAMSTAVQ
jgi:hypothetical protein